MVTRRRVIIALGASALTAPLALFAQRPVRIPRIGYLASISGPDVRTEAFRQGLRELGYIEGQNIAVEWRYALGKEDALAKLAGELVELNVDIIVTDGSAGTRAVAGSTKKIPLVMISDLDPVGNGLIASLARPGGNITGLATLSEGLSAKRLQLLKEAIPGISKVGILWNPANIPSVSGFKELQHAAQSLTIQLQSLEVRGAEDFSGAFQTAIKAKAQALAVLSDALMFSNRQRLLELAAKNKLPTIHTQSLWSEAGGLMSYGTNFPDLFRRTAIYVDKILKGAKPAELPVEQPTKFELVLNMKTAKALGIKFPRSIMLQATKVIE